MLNEIMGDEAVNRHYQLLKTDLEHSNNSQGLNRAPIQGI
ncbi:hypothetical protein HISP_19950 (plasmid) [Haloarcula hispanica N601]|uniref:Uncharacterized protein n=1 Tax=Haloarcula hispanica N601 TaxID=1417673 RepID=V5TTU5_HALHI|nr:hypothetical protein HISP_19950 [Haloarcula hispanica N601]